MTLINASLHRVLDCVTVVVFALAPTLFGLTGIPATLAYVLAAAHLVLTLATQYVRNGKGLVPFPVHGYIELVVGIAILIAPFVLGWIGADRTFYVVCGVVFFAVWLLTDYRGVSVRV